jgi:hypothetical protein
MESYDLNTNVSNKYLQKMVFINNALEDGWSVKKKENSYIFTKKHENRQEIFDNNYLENFLNKSALLKMK